MCEKAYAFVPLRAGGGPLASRPVVAYATVDLDREAWVNQWRWHLNDRGYVVRKAANATIRLHRELLGLAPGDPREGDHKNRDKLDNRLSNLRVVKRPQGAQNRPSHAGSSSAYRGVSWSRKERKWVAQVRIAGVNHRLGCYDDEAAAAAAAADFRAKHLPFAVD